MYKRIMFVALGICLLNAQLPIKHLNLVNAQDDNGDTPLHLAKKLSVVFKLLEYGAHFSIKNNQAKTALDLRRGDYLECKKSQGNCIELEKIVHLLEGCETALDMMKKHLECLETSGDYVRCEQETSKAEKLNYAILERASRVANEYKAHSTNADN